MNFGDLKFFSNNILKLEKKIDFKNLNIEIEDRNKKIIDIENINFSNFGYGKNIITGKIFENEFKIKFNNSLSKVNFELLDAGVTAVLNISENALGKTNQAKLHGKVLKSNFKLDFTYDENLIEIYNFIFRNKELSFDSNGFLELKPFFKINIKSIIKDFNVNLIKNLDIEYFLNYKDYIKRLNSENKIIFKSQKFNRSLIDSIDIETRLVYGRLNISKIFFISNSKFICHGELNLLKEFPIYFFDCSINSPDKKKLLKTIKVNNDFKDKKLNLNLKGNLNILNNKINFLY